MGSGAYPQVVCQKVSVFEMSPRHQPVDKLHCLFMGIMILQNCAERTVQVFLPGVE